MPVIWSRGAAHRGAGAILCFWAADPALQNSPWRSGWIQGWIGLCCRLPPVLSVQKVESFRGPWQLETTGCSFPAPRCYVAMWSEHFRLVVLMVLYIYLLIRNQCIMSFISKSISLFILAGLGFWPQSPHVWPIPWCRGRCNALSSAYDAALSREHAAQRRVAKDSRCWEAVWEMISVGGDEQLATGITRYNSVYAMEKYVSHIHKPRTGPGSSYSDESSRVIDSWIINSPVCIHNLVQTHLISLVIYPTIYIYTITFQISVDHQTTDASSSVASLATCFSFPRGSGTDRAGEAKSTCAEVEWHLASGALKTLKHGDFTSKEVGFTGVFFATNETNGHMGISPAKWVNLHRCSQWKALSIKHF